MVCRCICGGVGQVGWCVDVEIIELLLIKQASDLGNKFRL